MTVSSTNDVGKNEKPHVKERTGPVSYIIPKNKFKMDEMPKYETGNHQNPRGEHRQEYL